MYSIAKLNIPPIFLCLQFVTIIIVHTEHNNGLPSFNSKGKASSDSEYLNQLKALNVGVTEWISSHVKKNPHVDLTPIFRDYEKHLKTIDAKVSGHHAALAII